MSKIKRIVSAALAVLMLAMSVVSFSACVKEYMYQAGTSEFGRILEGPSEILGVVTDTNTFQKENITLDLYVGLYSKRYELFDLFGETTSIKQNATKVEYVYYTLAICKPVDWYEVTTDENYSNIDNFYCLKEIQMASLKNTNDYGYSYNVFFGAKYNHCERITIPEELITGQSGEFIIACFDLVKPNSTSNTYELKLLDTFIRIPYTVNENGTVTLQPEIKEDWRTQ